MNNLLEICHSVISNELEDATEKEKGYTIAFKHILKIMEGIKETKDKLVYDIDFDYITGMAERMQLNRHKYEVGNWKRPIDVEELKQALFRHVIAIMQDEYSDEQRYGHLYAVGCNAFMIIQQLKNYESEILLNKEI